MNLQKKIKRKLIQLQNANGKKNGMEIWKNWKKQYMKELKNG